MEYKSYYLKQRQSLPLAGKELVSVQRIREWYEYNEGMVYVSFSGGIDSAVLLHLTRRLYPSVPAVFADTGLEYPENRELVKSTKNVIWIKPKMLFNQVIKKYGYPIPSKEQALYISECQRPTKNNWITRRRRLTGVNGKGIQTKTGMISKKWRFLIDAPFKISDQCCDVIKKRPLTKYGKETGRKPYIGTLAEDSRLRFQSWLRDGCNSFKRGASAPLSIWRKQDIWDYIKKHEIKYSKIYDMGESKTGCMFCMFGIAFDKTPNRFQRMKITHPRQHEYCMEKLGLKKVLEFAGFPYE